MKHPIEHNAVDSEAGPADASHVSIVDDDESVREAIKSLLRSVGLDADAFASAEEFLDSDDRHNAACLILDVRMPGMSGLELQQRLIAGGWPVPVIFITGHDSDEGARARAIASGAVDFLGKPFSEEALLEDVYAALGPGMNHRQRRVELCRGG